MGSEADKLSEQRPRNAALTKHKADTLGSCGAVTVRDDNDAILVLRNCAAGYKIKFGEHAEILAPRSAQASGNARRRRGQRCHKPCQVLQYDGPTVPFACQSVDMTVSLHAMSTGAPAKHH